MRLPTPGAHDLPEDATIAVPVPPGGLILNRLLESETPRHWVDFDQALAASERRVAFVARVDLEPDPLVHAALTEKEGPGHVDVWASPHLLLRAVSNVVRYRIRT